MDWGFNMDFELFSDEIKNLITFFEIDKYKILSNGVIKLSLPKNKFKDVIKHMKIYAEYEFDILFSVSAADYGDNFVFLYDLFSTQLNLEVIISVDVSKIDNSIDTVCDIFPSANWDEREIYDLLGIKINNHPDLRRLLMPKDWIGHPLRKDYVLEDERLAWNK